MKYRLLVRNQANRELRHVITWYEAQRPGLGQEFFAEVESNY